MDIYEAIEKRYSCRAYAKKPVEQDKLERIINSGISAPTARNLKDWRFIIVTDPNIKNQLALTAHNKGFVYQAPVVVVGCSNSDHVMTCGQRVGPIDLSIAMEHMAIAATSEGLATCWIGGFFSDKVRQVLGIPDWIEIVELMTIGYAADEKIVKEIEPVENFVCYEKWRF